MKKFFALILVAGLGILVWLAWVKPPAAGEPEPQSNPEVPVHVAKITLTTLRNCVTGYGLVEPEPTARARVATQVAGVVDEVKCAEGQRVDQGALLFRLDSRVADIAADFAEKTLERQKRLAAGEGTSQKALQDAEQQMASARMQQALLKITSPLSGVVTKINTSPGEAADLNTVLAEVADLDRLVLTANIPCAEMRSISPGQTVEVFASESTNALPAQVVFASQQVDPKTGAGPVRISLPKGSGLRLGQFAKFYIITEEHKNCLAVPLDSLANDATGAARIALVEDDKATLKTVKAGLRNDKWVEVEADDLKPDMTVVTDGAYELIMTERFATRIRIARD